MKMIRIKQYFCGHNWIQTERAVIPPEKIAEKIPADLIIGTSRYLRYRFSGCEIRFFSCLKCEKEKHVDRALNHKELTKLQKRKR